MEHEDIVKIANKGEDHCMLLERVEKLKKKFISLDRFTVKMVHHAAITLSTILKDEMDKKAIEEGSNWVEGGCCFPPLSELGEC